MQISSVRNSYNTAKNLSATSFKGGLTDSGTRKVLNMLKPTITEIINGKGMEDIKITVYKMAKKYKPFKINSIGVMIVPDEHLSELCEGKVLPKALNSVKGFCVSVGDHHGPVETWSKAYETKLVVIPKR